MYEEILAQQNIEGIAKVLATIERGETEKILEVVERRCSQNFYAKRNNQQQQCNATVCERHHQFPTSSLNSDSCFSSHCINARSEDKTRQRENMLSEQPKEAETNDHVSFSSLVIVQ